MLQLRSSPFNMSQGLTLHCIAPFSMLSAMTLMKINYLKLLNHLDLVRSKQVTLATQVMTSLMVSLLSMALGTY
jgi:hypothetical protein